MSGNKQLSQPFATIGNLPTFSELAKREYYTRVEQERHALYGVKPEMEREIGEVPMPVPYCAFHISGYNCQFRQFMISCSTVSDIPKLEDRISLSPGVDIIPTLRAPHS